MLTDVRIDWYLPENMEAFLSPSEIPPLYPGNRLIGYCTLYDMKNFKAKKTEVHISTFFYQVHLCVSAKENVSNITVLFYSLKDGAIKVCILVPLVQFLANQMTSFHLLLPPS